MYIWFYMNINEMKTILKKTTITLCIDHSSRVMAVGDHPGSALEKELTGGLGLFFWV